MGVTGLEVYFYGHPDELLVEISSVSSAKHTASVESKAALLEGTLLVLLLMSSDADGLRRRAARPHHALDVGSGRIERAHWRSLPPYSAAWQLASPFAAAAMTFCFPARSQDVLALVDRARDLSILLELPRRHAPPHGPLCEPLLAP